jgi:hypothetical protein
MKGEIRRHFLGFLWLRIFRVPWLIGTRNLLMILTATCYSNEETRLNSFISVNEIKTAPIFGITLSEENTHGAMAGCSIAGPLSYARVSTSDTSGIICAYTGEDELTNDSLDTFGHRAV